MTDAGLRAVAGVRRRGGPASGAVEVPVQINGKVRGKVIVSADATEEQTRAAAAGNERIARLLDGREVIKVIVVPGKFGQLRRETVGPWM